LLAQSGLFIAKRIKVSIFFKRGGTKKTAESEIPHQQGGKRPFRSQAGQLFRGVKKNNEIGVKTTNGVTLAGINEHKKHIKRGDTSIVILARIHLSTDKRGRGNYRRSKTHLGSAQKKRAKNAKTPRANKQNLLCFLGKKESGEI